MTFTCFCSFNVANSTLKMTFAEEQILCDITYMWNLKKKKKVQVNLFTKQKQSHTCKKQSYDYQGGKGRMDKLEDWDWDRYTLLNIKQITNKDLLYRTGNSTQYSVMTYNRKRTLKKSGYMDS